MSNEEKFKEKEVLIKFYIENIEISTSLKLKEVPDFLEIIPKILKKPIEKIVPQITEKKPLEVVSPIQSGDDPITLLSYDLEIEASKLKRANLIGIKDNKIHIFKTSKFSASDGVLIVLYCSEKGLKNTYMPYENLKEMFSDIGIKGKSPLYLIISNLKSRGYLDKTLYDKDHNLQLTTKGENKARGLLKSQLS